MVFARSIATVCVASSTSFGVAADPSCCRALTLECLACDAGLSEAEYCERHRDFDSCNDKLSTSEQPDADGGRSEEKVPDSMLWELFNASGKAFQKQAEHEAQAMGLNGDHFQEFVPVRYAEQLVSGINFFVRVRIDPNGVFIDTLIRSGFFDSNEEPKLQAIRFVKDEEDPIDDFNARPTFQPSTEQPIHHEDIELTVSTSEQPDADGGRSEEKVPDSMLWELFNASGNTLEKQAEHEAQAMGLNGDHFEEFVPVRYAEQLVSGINFFVRVRIDPNGVFIDTLIHRGLSTSNEEPELQAIRFVKDEEDPIDDFNARPTFQPVEIVV